MQANVKLALLKPRSAVWCFVQEKIGGFKLSFNFSRAFPVQLLHYYARGHGRKSWERAWADAYSYAVMKLCVTPWDYGLRLVICRCDPGMGHRRGEALQLVKSLTAR